MKPKEKAEELVNKFVQYTPAEEDYEYPYAKQCALVAVDEVISYCHAEHIEYWKKVKQEIEKL